MRQSGFYTGTVWHERHQPRRHGFQYRLFMVWLDLDRMDETFRGRWLWSHRFPTLAWFRRKDHVGDPSESLSDTIRNEVALQTGTRPTGPIGMLTHLRYFGFYMNPITLYYCYDASGDVIEHVVAEVHNTPWNERHCYCWPGTVCYDPTSSYRCLKSFHVSPFMEMNHSYRCQLNEPDDTLAVQLENEQGDQVIFGAGMDMAWRPWSRWNSARMLVGYPLMTLRVFIAIYYQAFRLWWKGVPFQAHPRQRDPLEEHQAP